MYDLFCDFSFDYDIKKKATDKDINEMLVVVEDFHNAWPSTYMKLTQVIGVLLKTFQLLTFHFFFFLKN